MRLSPAWSSCCGAASARRSRSRPGSQRELPMIMADPGQIENALLNLAVNARDAMPDGGRLIIETARARSMRTTPPCIRRCHAGELCHARGDRHRHGHDAGGAGARLRAFLHDQGARRRQRLGLSMVYGFVKQSGGHVQLYSELGHGTTVRLYLPAHGRASAAAATAPPAVRSRRAASGETILVVEDDPRVRRVAVRRLKELGYAVIEADSGPAALRDPRPGGADRPALYRHRDGRRHDGRRSRAGGPPAAPRAEDPVHLRLCRAGGEARAACSLTKRRWLGKPYSIDELQAQAPRAAGPLSRRALSRVFTALAKI